MRLTAEAPGAIGVVLVCGEGVEEVLRKVVPGVRVEKVAVGSLVKTTLVAADGAVMDEGLAVHVGEGRWELHVHGGMAVVEGVMRALEAAGARVVAGGEEGELLGAGMEGELQMALPGATTETALRLLLAQREAGGKWAGRWRAWLAGRGSGLWEFHAAVQWRLKRSAALERLLVPARVAIVGPPNAGKSTLANALLGRRVSITSAEAGTTRDWVDARAVFAAGGVEVPVVLVDTAGVRETADELERQSILRTRRQAAAADVVVLLLDATRPSPNMERGLMGVLGDVPTVVAVNKVDAVGAVPAEVGEMGAVAVSAKLRQGLGELMEAVLGQLDLRQVGAEAVAFNKRLRGLLEEMASCDDARRCAELLEMCGGLVV
jgi:tRNA modification GTPase